MLPHSAAKLKILQVRAYKIAPLSDIICRNLPTTCQPTKPPAISEFTYLLFIIFFYQDPTQMTSIPAQLVHSFKGFVLTSSPPPPTQAARFLSVTKTDKIIYPGPDKNFRLANRYNWYCFLPNKFFDLVPAKKNCLGPDRIFCLAIKYNCHTRLHLGFSAKLRIWQVSACKMEPRSGMIMYVGPTHPPTHPPGV